MKIIFKNLTNVQAKHLKNCCLKNTEYRESMKHVYIDIKERKIVVTDAHVIMCYPIDVILEEDCPVKSATGFKTNKPPINGFLVPLRYFDFSRYMNTINHPNDLEYVLTENQAKVYYGPELVFQCNYIDALFPNYKAVFPNETKFVESICLDINLIKKVHAAIPLPNKIVNLQFSGEHGIIKFKTTKESFEINGRFMPTA